MEKLNDVIFDLRKLVAETKTISLVVFIIFILISFFLFFKNNILIGCSFLLIGMCFYYIISNMGYIIANQNEIIKVLKKEVESKEK